MIASMHGKTLFATVALAAGLAGAGSVALAQDGKTSPELSCPKGWRLYADPTECWTADNRGAFVAYQGEWWRKVDQDPSAKIIQNPLSGEKKRIAAAELASFVGLNCTWPVAPYPQFAHGQQFTTTDYASYQCNNGEAIFLGYAQAPRSQQPATGGYYYGRSYQFLRAAPRTSSDRLDEYYREMDGDWSKNPSSGVFYKS